MSDDAETDGQPRDASPAPWTVKGMPREQRDAINAAARRADMTVAAFIWDACRTRIRDDRLPIGSAVPAVGGHPGAALASVDRASPHSETDELDKLSIIAVRLSAPDLKDTEPLKAVERAVVVRADRIR
jgi:hypothetical protein